MKQLELIKKVIDHSLLNENIRSVFMYGSFVKGEGDKFSDIEFYFFIKEIESFNIKNFVSSIDELLLFFKNEFGTDVAIYQGPIRAEYHFLKASEVGIIKQWEGLVSFSYKDKMVLVDKDKDLIEVIESIQEIVPKRNTPQNIEWLASSLINSLLQTANLIGRKEWGHAHMSFTYIQKYILWLIRIKEGSTEHWESPTKALEKDLSMEAVNIYKQLTPSSEEKELASSLKTALLTTEELFRDLKVSQEIADILRMIH